MINLITTIMSDCIFCKIIGGEIPSYKVYEDEVVFAFLDIQPVSQGHLLVIPKIHSANLIGATDTEIAALFSVARRLGDITRKIIGADGFNIIVNVGSAAGQLVFHTHVHVIPRAIGDGLQHWSKIEINSEELTKIAREISGKI
jgi:histidine triad (HIT) family protein